MKFPGHPFAEGKSYDKAGLLHGVEMTRKILEVMNSLGYRLLLSTNLARSDDRISLFFDEILGPNSKPKKSTMASISLFQNGKIIFENFPADDYNTLREIVSELWTRGISKEKTGDRFLQIKIKGSPFQPMASSSDSVESNIFVVKLVEKMSSSLKFNFLMSGKIHGDTESLFFIKDSPNGAPISQDLCYIMFVDGNKLRLHGFDDRAQEVVSKVVVSQGLAKKEGLSIKHLDSVKDVIEFKVKGKPFSCHGADSIQSRKLVCKLLEYLKFHQGLDCIGSYRISDLNDKSTLILSKYEAKKVLFSCVSFNDTNKIRFINFPKPIVLVLLSVVNKTYLPGIAAERARDDDCHEIDLNGMPWTHESSYNLHARSMLVLLLKQLQICRWKFVFSGDVSSKVRRHQDNGPDYHLDVDSWFFSFSGDNINNSSSRPVSSVVKRLPSSNVQSRPPNRTGRRVSVTITIDDLEDD